MHHSLKTELHIFGLHEELVSAKKLILIGILGYWHTPPSRGPVPVMKTQDVKRYGSHMRGNNRALTTTQCNTKVGMSEATKSSVERYK